MISFLYIGTILSNLFSSLLKRKSLIIKVFTLVVILIIWGGNTFGPDIYNYMNSYESGIHDLTQVPEKLYYFFMNIGIHSNLTFFQYRILITLCAILIFYFVLKKFDTNIYLVSAMYMLTIFFMDGIQIRNFLGLAFVYLGLYILYERNKGCKIKYCICIFLASLIHSALIIYLIFLIIPKDLNRKYSKKEIKLITFFGIGFFMYMYIFRDNLSFLVNITKMGGDTRAIEYANNTTRYGSIIIFALQISAVLISIYNYKKVLRKKQLLIQANDVDNLNKVERDLKSLKFIIYVNIIAILFVPFSIIQVTYYRLIRNLVLLNLIGIGIVSKWYRRNVKVIIVNMIFLAIWFYKEYIFGNGFEDYILVFMQNNRFLN